MGNTAGIELFLDTTLYSDPLRAQEPRGADQTHQNAANLSPLSGRAMGVYQLHSYL